MIRRGGHTSKDSAWHLSISTISWSGLVHWWWCLEMGALPTGPRTTSASCTVATSRRVCVRVGLSSISIQKVLWFLSWAEGVTGNHRFCDDSRSSDTCDSTRATLLAARHTLPTDPFLPKTYGCSARTPGRYNLRMLRSLPAHRAFPRRGHFDMLGPRHSTPTPDFPDFSVHRPFRYDSAGQFTTRWPCPAPFVADATGSTVCLPMWISHLQLFRL